MARIEKLEAPADGGASLDEPAFAAMAQLAALDEDPEALLKLVRAFLASAATTLDDLEAAARCADARTVARAAHGLKSSAAMFGVFEVSRLCAELENAADDGDEARSAALIAALRRAMELARKEIELRLPALVEG